MDEERFQESATILVVDDNPTNLSVISDHLMQSGYRVLMARDGTKALERAATVRPDLILLDVLMPGIDGYETCRRLKLHPELQLIPVIFMTALSDTADKVKAFSVGGVDYITKPFQQAEVLARVQTHLELQKRARDLQNANRELSQLRQMQEDLTNMVVHDLRSPIWSVKAHLALILEEETSLAPETIETMQELSVTMGSLLEMVSSLLDVAKMEAGAMPLHVSELDLASLIADVIAEMEALRRERRVDLHIESADHGTTLQADEGLLYRILVNLLSNSIKFTRDTTGEIDIHVVMNQNTALITVTDNGFGIPEEFRDRVFDKFGQVSARNHLRKFSTGLGLTFCKMAVEAHGGRIWLGEQPAQGTRIRMELPRIPTATSIEISDS